MLFKVIANLIFTLLVGLAVWGLTWLAGAGTGTRRNERIRSAGLTAWATLVSMHQTRRFGGGQFTMELTLNVANTSGPLTRSTLYDRIDAGWNLRPGDQVQVYRSPEHPKKVVLDKIMSPRYANAPATRQ